jgi:hypothetical protein
LCTGNYKNVAYVLNTMNEVLSYMYIFIHIFLIYFWEFSVYSDFALVRYQGLIRCAYLEQEIMVLDGTLRCGTVQEYGTLLYSQTFNKESNTTSASSEVVGLRFYLTWKVRLARNGLE